MSVSVGQVANLPGQIGNLPQDITFLRRNKAGTANDFATFLKKRKAESCSYRSRRLQ